MNESGQTVCLNMIVKNEAPVIRRCLDSVRPIIDRWAIADTGSTDWTKEIIIQHLKDLPGELHERPWVDFSHNRSEALALARGHGDYVFVIDADEVLDIQPGFKMPHLTADSLNLLIRYGGCSYLRKQMVRNTLPWRYVGVLHEYITCTEARTEDFLAGLHTEPHHDGARARDASTYRRDALILEKALLDDPANARYVFYLAQSYRDAGDLELALRNYKRRIELGGFPDEVWYSLYQVAQLKERMQNPWPEVLESYLAAWQYLPDRAGPLYRIAMHYQAKGEYNISHLYLAPAMKVPRPAPNRLFVEHTLYDFQMPLEHGVACYYVGKHAEAIATNNALLRSGLTPAHAIDQVIRNRRFSIDAIYPKPPMPQTGLPLCLLVPFTDPGPELDDTVESLCRLEGESFRVVFLDCGSHVNQKDRLPLADARFGLHRFNTSAGERESIERYTREHCKPDEIVVALRPGHRMPEPDTLKSIRAVFEDPECWLAYGQFRTASGELGLSEPAPSEAEFVDRGADFAGDAAIAFRAGILKGSAEKDLFQVAGFAHTRFSDDVDHPNEPHRFSPQARRSRGAPRKATADQLPDGHAGPAIARQAINFVIRRAVLPRTRISDRYRRKRAVPQIARAVCRGAWARPRLREVHLLGCTRPGAWRTPEYFDGRRPWRNRLSMGRRRLQPSGTAHDPGRPHAPAEFGGLPVDLDHPQFIEEKRLMCWVDWTLDGASTGAAQLAPGTLMMRRDSRFRYPEKGPYARQGEDSVLLEALFKSTSLYAPSQAPGIFTCISTTVEIHSRASTIIVSRVAAQPSRT